MIELNKNNIASIKNLADEYSLKTKKDNIFCSVFKNRILTDNGEVYLIKKHQSQKSLIRFNTAGVKDFEKEIPEHGHFYLESNGKGNVIALTILENGKIRQNSIINENKEIHLDTKSVLRISESGNYVIASNDYYAISNSEKSVYNKDGSLSNFQVSTMIENVAPNRSSIQLVILENDLAVIRYTINVNDSTKSSLIFYSIPEKNIVHEMDLIKHDGDVYDPLFRNIQKAGGRIFIPSLLLNDSPGKGAVPYLIIYNLNNLESTEMKLDPYKNIKASIDGKQYLISYRATNDNLNKHVIYDVESNEELLEIYDQSGEISGFFEKENEYEIFAKKDSMTEKITIDKNGNIKSRIIGIFSKNFKRGLVPVEEDYLDIKLN